MGNNKLVCIVGMTGAGKSIVADEFVKVGHGFFRFGQITLDECIKRGDASEKMQKEIREGFRAKHGMAAFAILNMPKIEGLLENGNTIGDGLYSWAEYKVLKKKYGKNFIVIAIYTPPEVRYERLEKRYPDKSDVDLRGHHFTREEAKSRDYVEIENSDKGGPIAMADYTIINIGDMEEVIKRTKEIIDEIKNK